MGHCTEPQETAGPSEGAISYVPQGASSIPPTDETPDASPIEFNQWVVWVFSILPNDRWPEWGALYFKTYASAKREYDNYQGRAILSLTYHVK